MTTQILGAQPPTEKELWDRCEHLKGYLIRLTRNRADADDLVHETWIKASKGLHNFEVGTNLDGWLITIARNLHSNEKKRYRREVQDPDNIYAEGLTFPEEQEWRLIGHDIQAAFEKLPPVRCRAVKLALSDGESYEYIAELEHVPVGTIKSRISRGCKTLKDLLCDEVPENPKVIVLH